jgi:hypothetical protein
MINTFCKFYYGHEVNEENYKLSFSEGAGPEIIIELDLDSYSFEDFIAEVVLKMNDSGTYIYTYTTDRDMRKYTIDATGSFKILASTSTVLAYSCFDLLGFSTDTSLATSQTSTASVGSVWSPQMMPQNYVSFDDNQSANDPTVRRSASGNVEMIKYGDNKLMELSFSFITNIAQNNAYLKTDLSGVENCREFLKYVVNKNTVEFIPDEDKPDVYFKCILEKTQDSSDGVGFKLKELYARGLPGYYETGLLTFRLLE